MLINNNNNLVNLLRLDCEHTLVFGSYKNKSNHIRIVYNFIIMNVLNKCY